MVDYNGLENRRAERHRGFESLSLRKTKGNELETNELPFNFAKIMDAEWTKKSAGITNIPQRNCDNTKNPKNE